MTNGRRVRLGDIAEFVNGVAFKPEDWGDKGQRIIRIQNLSDPTKPYNRTTRVVADKYHVQPGDLLVSWSATLGVFVWHEPDVGLVNQHIFRVIPDTNRVDGGYLRHMLSDALIEMERHLHGATMKHVNRKEFLSTEIPLPPLTEQKRIAGILDTADVLRSKRRESLTQIDSLLQSTFLDLFGDPVTNPMGWKVSMLGEVALRVTDGTHQSPKWSKSGVPFLFVRNIRDRNIDFQTSKFISDAEYELLTARCPIEVGDVLYTTVGSYGNPAMVHAGMGRFAFQRHIAHIKPNPGLLDSRFLEVILDSAAVRQQADNLARGVAQKTLNLRELKSFVIFLPPLAEQRRFATIVESVEHLKARMHTHLAELDTLFASLQSRAFAGDL